MKIHSFRGIRYSPQRTQPERLAGPPYDQIDSTRRDEFHQTPFHIAHLSRPVGTGGRTPHQNAAHLHRTWRSDSVLEQDDECSLYPVEIVLPDGTRRLGLTALVALEPPEAGIIRPHELTVAKTVEERLGLIREMQVDLEPILLLSEDDGTLDELLEADVQGAPLVEHVDDFGNTHRLFRRTDPERIRLYRDLLSAAPGLIADGHHRYRVASLYAEEVAAAAGTAAAAKLSVITSLASPGLAIDPIHRGLASSTGLGAAREKALEVRSWGGPGGNELADAVARATGPALAVSTAEGHEIWHLDPATGPPDLPAAASDLAVVLLHHSLLPAMGQPPESATDGTVQYRSDPARLAHQVASGDLAVGFYLPPMTASSFAAAIADGDVLPPKSTRFLPKIVSGLVWGHHEDPLDDGVG